MGGMQPTPQEPAPWRKLRERLAGYLAARARGILASEFVLVSREGEEVGRLRVHGPQGADLEAGGIEATIERVARSRYTMLDGEGKVVLRETARTGAAPDVRYGDRVYEVRLSLLRNAAVALSPDGVEAARVAGGLTNRSYEVYFDAGEEGGLPLAVFLLYRIVALRRRAFLANAGEAASP